MKRFLVSALTVAAIAASTARADAAFLTIVDNGKAEEGVNGNGGTWTLDAPAGCTSNCVITLSVQFANPTEYNTKLLDGIQWTITGGDLQSITLTNTTAGATTNWEVKVGSGVNQGGGPGDSDSCGGGNQDSFCGNYVVSLGPPVVDSNGLAISNNTSWSWTFNANFGSALPNPLTTGNIRALFNNPDGSNYTIFSPSGGTFQGQGTPLQGQGQPQQGSPEPASVLLFGAALTAVGMRLRRARA